MEEGKRKKELDRFYLSLFTFDEIILRGLTAVKVRPFSGSVNRKKIVDSAKLDQARGAWPRSVERNRNRKPIWRITSGSVSRLPFCLTDLFMLPPSVQCFFFASSLSLTFEEEWNLEAGPSSSRLESSVRHSFLYLFSQLFQVLETRRTFFMKYTRFIKGEENFFLKLEQQ